MHNLSSNSIKKKAEEFSFYVANTLFSSEEEKLLIEKLVKDSEVYIFGGVIKDFFFSKSTNIEHRDIDLVVTNFTKDISEYISKFLVRQTLFGGYKLKVNQNNYDIWSLEDTWALKEYYSNFRNKREPLPHTSFFNITAIVFSIKRKEFILNDKFVTSLNDNILDIVFEPNPLPSLCIVKAYDYINRYNLYLSQNLRKFIYYHYQGEKENFDEIQMKHYGTILYSKSTLERFWKKVSSEVNSV